MAFELGGTQPINLDGQPFDWCGQTDIVVREPARALPETPGGGRREELVWRGTPALAYLTALVPEVRRVLGAVIRFDHVRGTWPQLIDDLLAAPGVHTLALWKPVTATWLGDGERSRCWAPWLRADLELPTHVPSLLQGRPELLPRIRVGWDGAELEVSEVDVPTLDGGTDPDPGEVWWEEGGQRFRLPEAPAAGERIYCRYQPLLSVYRGTEDDRRQYTGARPGAEPRTLVFVGAG